MKKHGFLWWLFIGWWWRLYMIPFRIIKALIKMAKAKKPAGPEAVESLEPGKESFKVAGTSFRQDAIKALGTKNPDYSKTRQAIQDAGLLGKWIYEYEFTPREVDLVPEPDNPHDRDAIKVVVDGVHIGYIKAEACAHVHDLLCTYHPQQVACFIGGGKRKRYNRDGKEDYVLERDETSLHARLTITTK